MQTNRNMKRAIWMLAILFLASFDAVACTCDLPWPKQNLKQQISKARRDSRAVFSGTVLKIDEAGYMLKVTLKVERSWKGLLPTEVVLTTGRGRGDCGYEFELGQTYLVYAYGDNMNALATNICQRTVALVSGGDDLKILGKLKRPRP
jgi:hypothetical protein